MFTGFGSFGGAGSASDFINLPQRFESFFRCYPISMMNDRIRKDDANFWGKIFLPPSALNKLTMLNIRYPMLFELTSNETGKVTHGGVLEFTAEEGRVYLPQWMMETLSVKAGSLLTIATTDIPLGSYVNLEPQSTDFLDISDPKAVLENSLRNFSTLTKDDIIEISYNNKIYRIKILEVKPESPLHGICVIETDLVTDFAPPVGYVEPDYKAMQKEKEEKMASKVINLSGQTVGSMSRRINYTGIAQEHLNDRKSFAGIGSKLSGKATKKTEPEEIDVSKISLDGEPRRLDLPEGQLFFGFPIVLPKAEQDDDNNIQESNNFIGNGQSLRKTNKRKDKNTLEKNKQRHRDLLLK
ncbi:hypothetical protein TPHA_0B04420 [Tetrapisispora phaffii CBS 4417]|uniref:Ubiquitin fusion degradation protein 1 n=1 Tax=Tetrapisispora phaffii (strain ATCC 24235 / CBS 4417 / NBRC 1672 / NRRL Y-8282 / UCD 70-5) TaxID=1071381 RepID=G8BQ30_TETPH|nr:hypothetical protein TPHA_0B04420 [Tetrapisispora phaffii CBS 4417]CCE62111.1 hypothetical protein TPHA_0B04420 [Tetrapisispora phaffii CBS 4417]